MVSLQPQEKDDDTYRGAAAEFVGLILFQFFGGLTNAGAPGNGVVSTPDIVVSVLLWYRYLTLSLLSLSSGSRSTHLLYGRHLWWTPQPCRVLGTLHHQANSVSVGQDLFLLG